MSSTVTYKGDILTAVDYTTKILKTAGKYMEDDITITDMDNTLTITFSYNDQTEMWEPDKTFAETLNAYQAGKKIVASANDHKGTFIDYVNMGGNDSFYYIIYVPFDEPNETPYYNWGTNYLAYIWTSNGINIDEENKYYNTSLANAVPSDVANGKYFYNTSGIQIGTAPGGDGDTYTLTTVVPQQTFTAATSSAGGYQAEVTYNNILVEGKSYLITYDNEVYISECKTLFGSDAIIGAPSCLWDTNSSNSVLYPFAVDWDSNGMYAGAYDTNQHTIKVDLLEFVDGPLNLIAKSIIANGTYNASSDNADGYSSVTVNVPTSTPTLQAKTATPTTSQQTVMPDSGYDGLSSVTVSAMPLGSATAPSSITDTAATISTGTNTLTLTKSVSVTPSVTAGYVSSGTAGDSSISLTASVPIKAATTITPGTANQTIAAGTYLTGTQTIAGDADLIANNIISTANIFGVQGSVVVQNYYTGSSAPTSSLGQNGDIYLQE